MKVAKPLSKFLDGAATNNKMTRVGAHVKEMADCAKDVCYNFNRCKNSANMQPFIDKVFALAIWRDTDINKSFKGALNKRRDSLNRIIKGHGTAQALNVKPADIPDFRDLVTQWASGVMQWLEEIDCSR